MKPHKRNGRAAKKRRQEAAQDRANIHKQPEKTSSKKEN